MRAALAAALCTALLALQPAHAQLPTLVSKGASGLDYGNGYEPQRARKLDELPPQVRLRVVTHLQQRLGPLLYKDIRFLGGDMVDAKLVQAAQGDVPAYRLEFALRRPEVGIDLYVATIELRADGSPMQEIDLPCYACHPEKLQMIDLAAAAAVAVANGMSESRMQVGIDYDREADALVWVFTQRVTQGSAAVDDRLLVDAHSGDVVARLQDPIPAQ